MAPKRPGHIERLPSGSYRVIVYAGTDPLTTYALQRDRRQTLPDDFPDQLSELLAYLEGTIPADHPFARLTTLPIVLSPAVKLSASTTLPPSCLNRDVNAWTTFLK